MERALLLFISVLPVYLILAYIYKKDSEKESRKLLTKLFIYGVLSCFPATLLELYIGSYFPPEENMDLITLFIYVFLSIALVEELCKWWMSYKISYNNEEFDQIYDGIVYTVFVSLGFACFENILYVFDSGFMVGILRMFLAIPGHACDAIVMGNYYSLAKMANVMGNRSREKRNLFLSILMPTITHTLYDYCLFTGESTFLILFIILVITIYIYSFKKVKHFSKIDGQFTS